MLFTPRVSEATFSSSSACSRARAGPCSWGSRSQSRTQGGAGGLKVKDIQCQHPQGTSLRKGSAGMWEPHVRPQPRCPHGRAGRGCWDGGAAGHAGQGQAAAFSGCLWASPWVTPTPPAFSLPFTQLSQGETPTPLRACGLLCCRERLRNRPPCCRPAPIVSSIRAFEDLQREHCLQPFPTSITATKPPKFRSALQPSAVSGCRWMKCDVRSRRGEVLPHPPSPVLSLACHQPLSPEPRSCPVVA